MVKCKIQWIWADTNLPTFTINHIMQSKVQVLMNSFKPLWSFIGIYGMDSAMLKYLKESLAPPCGATYSLTSVVPLPTLTSGVGEKTTKNLDTEKRQIRVKRQHNMEDSPSGPPVDARKCDVKPGQWLPLVAATAHRHLQPQLLLSRVSRDTSSWFWLSAFTISPQIKSKKLPVTNETATWFCQCLHSFLKETDSIKMFLLKF